MREIRLQYVHRGQTYLTASPHSYDIFVIFLIGRRDGENNGFLSGVSLLPLPSRVVWSPKSIPLPFRTPATQAIKIGALAASKKKLLNQDTTRSNYVDS